MYMIVYKVGRWTAVFVETDYVYGCKYQLFSLSTNITIIFLINRLIV